MKKKIISLFLSAVLMMSSVTVMTSSAAESENEPPSKSVGTFFFDMGDWADNLLPNQNNPPICFYIWDSSTREYASREGWSTKNYWLSEKLLGNAVEGKKNLVESYELDLTGRENHEIYVTLIHRFNITETYDFYINSSVFGHTAHLTGEFLENPSDFKRNSEKIAFDGGENIGSPITITSKGEVQGDILVPGKTKAGLVAYYILKYLFYNHEDSENSIEQLATADTVANVIAALDTTPDEVWEKYKEYSEEDRYNEAEAKKVILPKDRIYGDVDSDNKLTAVDSLRILRASVNLEEITGIAEICADVDNDGKLTSYDALEVLRVSVNLPTTSMAGTRNDS